MLDTRPVIHLLGFLSLGLGALMLVPAFVDWRMGNDSWVSFCIASFVTCLVGLVAALSTRNALGRGIGRRDSFLLAASVWLVLPLAGALPFALADATLGFRLAFFESMSGMTTTGTTVFVGLDDMAQGVLLWRSMLQWIGGLGIVVLALVFLPVLRVGGMQHFQSESFDTMGKVMPRVYDISVALLQVYIGLTVLALVTYLAFGMSGFDAVNHAMTTIATGGFSTSDLSFAKFIGPTEYVATVFMILAGLPFIRFIQMMGGSFGALWRDVQVRAFLRWALYAVIAIMLYRCVNSDVTFEVNLRSTLFNVVTLFTGTGYGSDDVSMWGDFPLLVVMLVGFIGACTASTGCSLKVFRYLVLFEAIKIQLMKLRSPHQVSAVRIGGRRLEDDVISSVIVMFTAFMVGFLLLALSLGLVGLETRTALTAAWTAICNVGPVFGPEVGPTGAVDSFPASAHWLMIAGMYLGRLEIMAVMILILPRFWRG